MILRTTRVQAMLRQALALAESMDGAQVPLDGGDMRPLLVEYPTLDAAGERITISHGATFGATVARFCELTDHASAEMRGELSKTRGWKEP